MLDFIWTSFENCHNEYMQCGTLHFQQTRDDDSDSNCVLTAAIAVAWHRSDKLWHYTADNDEKFMQ